MSAELEFLDRGDGIHIAYRFAARSTPTVVFLGGFCSDMTGRKATRLDAFCRERGQGYLRFDYRGHGASSGKITDGTIGAWAEDARAVVEALTEGPLVLVGSSMGGWVMLLVALALTARVKGLVGVAAAPDFTERLMWDRFSEEQRATLAREGMLLLPSEYDDGPYPITNDLIDEGRRHLLLGGPIGIRCPVRLLHGMDDTGVPWETAVTIAEALASDDVRLTFVKGAGHRFSDDRELEVLTRAVAELSDLAS